MPPIEFLRTAHHILSSLPFQDDRQVFDEALAVMVRGEAGNNVQRVLAEAGVTLDRSAMAATFPTYAKGIIYDFESRAFKALAMSGRYEDAVSVLSERLLGPEGVVIMASEEFKTIAANVHHLADPESEEQAMYWRKRVKDYKYSLLKELKSYVQASLEAARGSEERFSEASSHLMNKLLDLRQAAESQQELVINLNISSDLAGFKYLRDINQQLLGDFLREAAAGSNAVVFARRLQALNGRRVPLSVFEDAYARLQSSSGLHYRGLKETFKNFEKDSAAALKNSQDSLDEIINVMDFKNLPAELDVGNLAMPLTLITKNAFEAMRIHTDTWLQDIRDMIDVVNGALNPEKRD